MYTYGMKLITFPMVREYDFDHMTVDDFRLMFNDYGTAPNPKLISGIWRMRTIANSNHSQ